MQLPGPERRQLQRQAVRAAARHRGMQVDPMAAGQGQRQGLRQPACCQQRAGGQAVQRRCGAAARRDRPMPCLQQQQGICQLFGRRLCRSFLGNSDYGGVKA